MEQQERNIQPISSQEHRDAISPMFSCEINWSEGFPNMVHSTEYSEAVNARYTFQPLWVSTTTDGAIGDFTTTISDGAIISCVVVVVLQIDQVILCLQ